MTDYVAGITIPYIWIFLFTQSNRRLPPLIRSETGIMTYKHYQQLPQISVLSVCGLNLCMRVCHMTYIVSPSFSKFLKQVLKARLKIHRPSLLLTSSVGILRLNEVSFLPKYLSIRLFLKYLEKYSKISNEPRIPNLLASAYSARKQCFSERKLVLTSDKAHELCKCWLYLSIHSSGQKAFSHALKEG